MGNGRGYVLIVDDDSAIRGLLRDIVSSETDRAVKTVGNAADGLAAISEGVCCLVLLDMRLGEVGGESLAVAIRRQSADVPILLISGLSESRISDVAQQVGAVGYINKPFEIDDVSVAIRRALLEGPETLAGAEEEGRRVLLKGVEAGEI